MRETPWPDLHRPLALSPCPTGAAGRERGEAAPAAQGGVHRFQNCGVNSTSTDSSSSRPSSMAMVQIQIWKSVSAP